MIDQFKDSHLRRIPLFSQLSDYHLSLLAQAFHIRRYNPGEFIFQQGEPTRGLHIFVDGQAVLYRYLPNGQNEQIATYQNGHYINDAAIFEAGTQTANLQAVRIVTTLLLTRENMGLLLDHYPELLPALGFVSRTEQPQPNVQLKAQRANEEVFLKTRRHWWAYIRLMWLPVLVAIPLWVLSAYFPVFAPIILPISLLIIGVVGAYLYFEWANDSVTITDQRVVRIKRTILTFSELRDEIAIESVQEANAQIPSLDPFAWIFRYGQVELKTAGKEGNFILDMMPNPQNIQNLIMDIHAHRKQAKADSERDSMRADLDRWLSSGFNPQQAAVTVENAKAKNVAKQKQDDIWTVEDGPLSPFVTKFPTDKGATVYRKHWSIWLRAVTLPALWIFAGLAVLLLTAFIPFLREVAIISLSVAMVMLLCGAVWFYFSDWDWRHDYYIVSDSNIIIINQRPLWLKNENEQLLLKQVDNVAAETSGIWQRMFKFGDVRVSLIGADQSKVFKNVSNPLDVQEEITRRRASIKQQEAAKAAQQQRDTIGGYLSLYHETLGANQSSEYNPSGYEPHPGAVRNSNRPLNIPRQSPSQPSMSEGRIYQPGNQYANPASDYGYAPQQGQYPQQQSYPPGYTPQPSYPPQQNYPQQGHYPPQSNYQQPNVNPSLPQQVQYPPQNYPPQAESYTGQTPNNLPTQPNPKPTLPPQSYPPNLNPPLQPPQGYNSPPVQPNLNPPPPPPERDRGRPPKFPRRRSEP